MSKPHKHVTIRDIASECNVHFSTVSLALRHDPKVNPETTRNILEAASRLGYKPNSLFSQMMTQIRAGHSPTSNETIAFVTFPDQAVEWKHHYTFRAFYEGVVEQATALNFNVDFFDDYNLVNNKLLPMLRARGIRSIIFSTFFKKLQLKNFPWNEFIATQIGVHSFLPNYPCVGSDQIQIIRKAIQHSLALGYKHIGVMMGNRVIDERVNNTWLAGYLLEKQFLPKDCRLSLFQDNSWLQKNFSRWLLRTRPEIILALDATYILQWISDLGLSIPGDITYADTNVPPQSSGSIAGVLQDHKEVGKIAATLLISRIYNNKTGPDPYRTLTRVEGRWADGASAPQKKR